jgi:hypothetical protein
MLRRSTLMVFLAIMCVFLANTLAAGQAPAAKAYLLNVSKGQLPSDTGMGDKTLPVIVEDFKELDGKAVKIPFAKSDSFGGRVGENKNWKRYAFLCFNAFNPATENVTLELGVAHARTSNFQTRVSIPIKLKPGRNEVKIGIAEMTNQNGSAAELANVVRWFIVDIAGKAPTVYFGDIYLKGDDAAAMPGPAATTGSQPLVGYHVKGKIGATEIDLTVTPFIVPGTGATVPVAAKTPGDLARLARIKAAKMPKLTKPVSFNSPEADAIVSALEVFPADNPWNLDVSAWPLHPNSKAIVASMGADKPLRYNPDMGFVLVPPDQKKVAVKLLAYAGESDKGPFPVPDIIPIEGWPVEYKDKKVTLEDVQRNTLKQDSDRHALVVDPAGRMLYEFYQLRKTDDGWQAAQASVFDLKSNKMRPEEWTSTDAAGLPIFPSVVRYDELKRGIVEHALRVTVVKSRRAYVYPARHFASNRTDKELPRMGERLRLRSDFDASGFSPELQAILKGLKKYGMFVADNGIDWAISVAPDPRIPVLHEELRKIKGSDFDVVQPPQGYQPPEEK